MRWKSERLGDQREVRKFAWLPVPCDNGATVWLELYTVVQKYGVGRHGLVWLLVAKLAD